MLAISCHPAPRIAYVNPVELAQKSEAVQAAQRELTAVAAPLQANVLPLCTFLF